MRSDRNQWNRDHPMRQRLAALRAAWGGQCRSSTFSGSLPTYVLLCREHHRMMDAGELPKPEQGGPGRC